MPFRTYVVNQKYVKNKRGDIGVYRKKIKKWIKSNKPYKQQIRGEAKPVYSTRFGFLNLYNRKEQQELICPSGYSISQCYGALAKLWIGYHHAMNTERSIELMKQYAKKIQDVQKDMGIKTTSFPHLGIYGDQLILNNKDGQRVVYEDHSALKKKQEEYETWQVENAKKIEEKLQKPDIEKGESILTFADYAGPAFIDDDYIDDDDYEDELKKVPDLLKPDEENAEELVVMTDDIPFIGYYSPMNPGREKEKNATNSP